MDIIRGQVNAVPKVQKVPKTVVLENKNTHENSVGTLLGKERNGVIVQNQKTGTIQKWPEQKTVTAERHDARQEKKLNVASEIIAALLKQNEVLQNGLGPEKSNKLDIKA